MPERSRFRQLLANTTVRLTLIYTLVFGFLAAGMVVYVSLHSSRLMISQVKTAAEDEVRNLAQVYHRGGARRLIRAIEARSRNPGANLYLISDASGRIIAGNVRSVEPGLLSSTGWYDDPFPYEPFVAASGEEHRAIAQVFSLPGNLRLLVGRDVGEVAEFRRIVARAFTLAVLAMLVAGSVLWLVIGRRALHRIDRVNETSARIMAGDLSQRLPVTGGNDEFDRLSVNLNKMIARVEKLNSGIVEMSDSIAHDLRTPLSRLRNQAEQALELPKGEDRTARLLQIVDEADGLIRTFDSLLMISQVNSGVQPARFSPVDLAELMTKLAELFAASVEEQGGTLTLNVDACPIVEGNEELLAQAITNLCDNALKYAPGDKPLELTLSVTESEQLACVSVADNGPGIASVDHQRALERFIRLEQDRSKPGVGLGLPMVAATAKLHNGALNLEDNRPGLVATLALPLASSTK